MSEIIVTGGRNYSDKQKIDSVLSFINPTKIIQGGASGADWLAKNWALKNDTLCVTVYADWDTYGKAAGPMRNLKMINDFPNAIIVAFPGGKGTANCIANAVESGRIVLEVK